MAPAAAHPGRGRSAPAMWPIGCRMRIEGSGALVADGASGLFPSRKARAPTTSLDTRNSDRHPPVRMELDVWPPHGRAAPYAWPDQPVASADGCSFPCVSGIVRSAGWLVSMLSGRATETHAVVRGWSDGVHFQADPRL